MSIAAQRKHIVQSLDILLYELHCSKPRELDAAWSLRAFFALLVSLNAVTVWNHATSGASDGKTVVLDFIGMAYTPSKTRVLSLDVFIVFLQMVLATIAYETSLAKGSDTTTHNLLPSPTRSSRTKPYPSRSSAPYVIDLSFRAVVARLWRPLPRPSPGNGNLDGLPLPNTTPWPLPAVGLRMLLGVPSGRPSGRNVNETGDGNARIPGALDG
ncbi:hypothetical protein B0H17DRAFT_89251 [Mycena rosella]|uniref:DUF1746 domain-containing protein n=1 Tax=Mycena rosella TaxID=1033263 RepID=A0AAD7E0I4_MYCRO|nr:hypothetical protein B0H17DRAFT_89251 [Mycena rosella]